MTNLDSILKSRDITLLTKVRLVKAMVFPVVIYGCESWTVKKAERQRIDAFELWCWRRLLRVPWTAGRPNQSILKEISLEYSLEGLNAEAETPILWPPDAKNWLIGEDPDVRECLTGGFLRALSHESSVPLQAEQHAAPKAEVIVWGRLGSPWVNILFRTKLLSLLPLSWDMDCVLTLWLTLPLVPLVTVAVCLVFWSLSFLKEVSCTTAYIYS